MRHIQKLNAPQSFIDKTTTLNKWSDYHNRCNRQKRALRKYILKYEQNFLCIYCESKISASNRSSHIEHIRPKSSNKYPELTFEYRNLVISCNGTCHNAEIDNSQYSCGHLKDNEYTENKFLNPIEISDIRDYFEYDFDDYFINPSNKDVIKAKYMIDTLHLNDGGLPKGREKALENFIKGMKNISDIKVRKEKMKQILDKENIAFISFLKSKYKAFL